MRLFSTFTSKIAHTKSRRPNQIQPGMTADAVSFLIGPPYRHVAFQRLGATAWDYRFRDTWGYMVELSVMVDAQNRVAGKVLQRIEPVDRD